MARRKARAQASPPRSAPKSRGPPRPSADTRGASGDIGCRFQRTADRFAQIGFGEEEAYPIQTHVDRSGVGQGRRKTLMQVPRACRRGVAVDHRKQAAAALARQRLGQFQIAAGGSIYCHAPGLGLALEGLQEWALALLGEIEIATSAPADDNSARLKRQSHPTPATP